MRARALKNRLENYGLNVLAQRGCTAGFIIITPARIPRRQDSDINIGDFLSLSLSLSVAWISHARTHVLSSSGITIIRSLLNSSREQMIRGLAAYVQVRRTRAKLCGSASPGGKRSNVLLRLALFPRTRISCSGPGIRRITHSHFPHPPDINVERLIVMTVASSRLADAANLQRNDARPTVGRYRDNERKRGREGERKRKMKSIEREL